MKTDCELAARVAAVASAGAGLIHLAVMPMHWREWWLSGLFFLSVAFFQIAWGFLGWKRPTGWVLAAGIVGNATVVTLWVVSRTAGMPFGPDAGNVEVVEAAGICALLLECYVVMASAWSWSQGANAEPVSALGGALVLVGANTVIIGAVAVGMASSLQDHHQHHGPVEALRQHHAPMRSGVHTPAAPAPEDVGMPVTDMALHTDADEHHHD